MTHFWMILMVATAASACASAASPALTSPACVPKSAGLQPGERSGAGHRYRLYREDMFFRTIGALGLVALSGIGIVVILTALTIIAAIAFPDLVPNFAHEPVLTK